MHRSATQGRPFPFCDGSAPSGALAEVALPRELLAARDHFFQECSRTHPYCQSLSGRQFESFALRGRSI
eukprot:scaffold7673_cov258-Pinguiococcus_pyrenoidosus.AAC.7